MPEAVWGEIFYPQTINCYVQSLSVNTDFCLQNSIEILCLTPKTRLFIINVSWTVFTQKLSFFYASIRSHFYTRRLRTQLVDISICVIDLFSVYLEIGASDNDQGVIEFTFDGANDNGRQFEVKVTQILCNSAAR